MINSSTPAVRQDTPPPPSPEDAGDRQDVGDDMQYSPELSPRSDDEQEDQEERAGRGVKRQWQETATDAQGQEPLASDEPVLKRPRTATAAPVCEIFSRYDDADIIALVRKHGGQVVERHGNFIGLTLPAADNLEFRVELFCLKHRLVRDNQAFTGRAAFEAATFGLFSSCLEAASLANRADCVRQLLATGMGRQAGALLRQTADRAIRAGALEASVALADECAFWVQGDGACTNGWPLETSIRVGNNDLPPKNWRAAVVNNVAEGMPDAMITGFRAGYAAGVLALLFKPEQHPASGQFFMRTLYCAHPLLKKWLIESGATIVPASDDKLVIVYSTDFDHDALEHKLLALQAESSSSSAGNRACALSLAAQWGDIDLFRTLLAQETLPLPYLEADLRAAAANGTIDIVRCLLAYGPAVDSFDESGETALSLAAAAGQTAICALLLEQGAALEGRGGMQNPLTAAAYRGENPTCAFLISQGAQIDGDSSSKTPLRMAAIGGWLSTCRLLLGAGARINHPTHGQSILSCAAGGGNVALYKYLVEQGGKDDSSQHNLPPLAMAARKNHQVMVAYLLEQGEPLEWPLNKSHSALMVACESGAVEAAELLLSRGAQVDPYQSPLTNALKNATEGDSLPLVKKLIPHFIPKGREYLMHALLRAIASCQPDIVRELSATVNMNPVRSKLRSTANPLLAVPYSISSIETGSRQDRHEILSTLLSHQPPLLHVDEKGNDALILAAKEGDAIAVDMLLRAGMQVGQKNRKGKNALFYALSNAVDEFDPTSSRIFTRVGQSLPASNSASLFHELMIEQNSPIKRDMCMLSYHATLQGGGNAQIPPDQKATLTYQLAASYLSPEQPGPDVEAELPLIMANAGFTSPLITVLLPSLQSLRQIRTTLFGPDLVPSARVYFNAFNGIYLTLNEQRQHLMEHIASYYMAQPIDEEWKEKLTKHSSAWLASHIETASTNEEHLVAGSFANLFNICAETARAAEDYSEALKRPARPAGEIANALRQEGVYAPLATRIEAAWSHAWQKVASQQATAAPVNLVVPDDSSRAHDGFWRELHKNPFGTSIEENLVEMIPEPVASLEDQLHDEFRAALKALADSPSSAGNLLRLPNASADAEKLYADLMFRQLQLLAQFINPPSPKATGEVMEEGMTIV